MPARILTPAQIERMAQMRERGLTIGQLSQRFAAEGVKISPKALYWQCLRVGAFPPGAQVDRRTHFGRGRPFTAHEDATLLEMREAGAGIVEIARAVNRPHNSVIGRLMTLARHEELAA
jgi:hypothetical protein